MYRTNSNFAEEKREHTVVTKVCMFLFVISLGLGEVAAIGPIKLSYITTLIVLTALGFENGFRFPIVTKDERKNKLLVFLFVWIAYSIVQLLWIEDYQLFASFFRIQVINVLVVYIITIYITSKKDWVFMADSLLALLMVSLLVGQWEIITGGHIVTLSGVRNVIYYRNRPVAFYGNGNDYATVLALGVFAILCDLSVNRYRISIVLIKLIVVVFSYYQIIAINCRGALYSVILFPMLALILWGVSRISRYSKRQEQLINSLLLFLLVALLLWVFSNNSPTDLVYRYSGSGNYRSDLGRLNMIVNGLKGLLRTFGFGVGMGQSILLNNINLHFFYLEILVESGVFVGGYLIYLFFSLSLSVNEHFSDVTNAVVRTFPLILVLLGVASSGMSRLRVTWIVFALFYLLLCDERNAKEKYD